MSNTASSILGVPIFFLIVFAIILAFACLRVVRIVRLRRLANKFGLTFTRVMDKGDDHSSFRRFNVITGNLKGNAIEVYDVLNAGHVGGETRSRTWIIIGNSRQKAKRKFWGVASVPAIESALMKVREV